ncbi:PRC-barrel domain-containing protein [Ruegeria sp. R14_0]|uniref:PRC-barrel domain-containing protein n=1 Tax=Ruegeria sp. R14_0 TaxID=2821100 RepID=UPI001ADCA019|nr:PRC-barrel domain-containing protein [Ruegeria sp. R14_0]MBO9448215.1 PRC-barrel domain-containing protein [Ruegeria sp. R14_0]
MTTSSVPMAGETILGVEVNVAKVRAAGYSANTLIGSDVQNEKGERVGAVHDLIVAPQGDVSLAIMEVGGFIGIDSKWVAVPAEMFEADDHGKFVLPKATEEELTKMPSFRYAQ